MSMDRQRRGQIGVNVVERIVLHEWGARWQPIDSVNDDGIDGLIFIENHGVPTGQIIFAQVKCTKVKAGSQPIIRIPVTEKKLSMNVDRWKKVVGGSILIHVNPDTFDAHWVNLRAPEALGKTQVFVPTNNKFNKSARKRIAALSGTLHRDLLITPVETSAENFSYLASSDHIQTAARKFYCELENSKIKIGGNGPRVKFTREGWHHITRRGRRRLTQLQSFHLLGAIPRILESIREEDLRVIRPKKGEPIEFVYFTSAVSFPFRHTAIIKIILWKRESAAGEINYSFRTIYEPRRRLNTMGTKK